MDETKWELTGNKKPLDLVKVENELEQMSMDEYWYESGRKIRKPGFW